MNDKKKIFTPGVLIKTSLFVIGIPMLPLLVSWKWNWWQAWVYAVTAVLGFIISRVLAGRKNPGLLAERARYTNHENVEPWDKALSPLLGFGGGLIPLVAGLDALFGPSADFSTPVELAALLLILAGWVIGSYALITNRFFSGMVRIQHDRGHQVVDSGPYAVVRHPGYAAALLTYLGTPLFLDTWWGFLPVALMLAVIVVRTRLEDNTLQEKLEGYKEYTGRVRWRLIPGIW